MLVFAALLAACFQPNRQRCYYSRNIQETEVEVISFLELTNKPKPEICPTTRIAGGFIGNFSFKRDAKLWMFEHKYPMKDIRTQRKYYMGFFVEEGSEG